MVQGRGGGKREGKTEEEKEGEGEEGDKALLPPVPENKVPR